MVFDKLLIEQKIKQDFILSGKSNFESFVKEEIKFYMEEFNVSYFWIVQLVLKVLKDAGEKSVIFEKECKEMA